MIAPLPSGLERLAQRRRFGVRPGLDRIGRLLRALGDPQRAFPCVHLAGTNGKGSTAAMVAAALQAAGFETGLYTSPHLCRFNERIVVGGAAIGDGELHALVERALEASEEATFFEVATAVALTFFAARGVAVAVVETGLGGRLDATNLVNPLVSVITPIDQDHVAVLGGSLAAIAAEKAGIIKEQVPVVCARQQPEVLRVITRRANELGAPLLLEGRDFTWIDRGPSIDFSAGGRVTRQAEVGLLGAHQRQNAAVALAALQTLGQRGWPVPEKAARRGLIAPNWPGRLERIDRYVLDCAHNPAAARQLQRALAAAPQPTSLIFGALADKAAAEMLAILAREAAQIVLCSPRGGRGADAHGLLALCPDAVVARDLAEALELAKEGVRTVITGSCYLVGEARALLLGADFDGMGDPAATFR